MAFGSIELVPGVNVDVSLYATLCFEFVRLGFNGSPYQLLRCLTRGSKGPTDLSKCFAIIKHRTCHLMVYFPEVVRQPVAMSSHLYGVPRIASYSGPFKIFYLVVSAVRIKVIDYLSWLWTSDEGSGNQPVNPNSYPRASIFDGYLSVALNVACLQQRRSMPYIPKVADFKSLREPRNSHCAPDFCHHSYPSLNYVDMV